MSSNATSATERARQAFGHLRGRGEVPAGLLPAAIERSWTRCLDAGLRERPVGEYEQRSRVRLAEERQRSRLLCDHALPAMESLYEHVASTQSMVVLTNADGYILHSLGDDDFLPRADRVALAPGIDWSETAKGTNAIGSALATGEPIVVHGPEHFFEANHFLTCAAAPIFGPDGDAIGLLDVSGDYRQAERHTLGLVRVMAELVERQLFLAAFPQAIVFQMHVRREAIGGPRTGLLAATPDGIVIAANRAAGALLDRNPETLRGERFDHVFRTALRSVLVEALPGRAEPFRLDTHSGATLMAVARAGSQVKSAFKVFTYDAPEHRRARTADCATAKAPEPAGQAMDRLDTGDPQVAAVLQKLRRVVGRDIPILIHGETGAGKELLARAIHDEGPRRDKPLVAVNCAAIPEGLIESELFGYAEGAFSGARRQGYQGRIQQADGGTLFLDEIGDMPLSLQARLLRVLQDRVVNPLGASRAVPVDIHVICATHHRLRDAVAAGRFREDLYYRLNGLAVTLPPLRERNDLPALIELLLSRELRDEPLPRIAPEVMDMFRRHTWPGNLRQLCNVLRTAVLLSEGGPSITREHLPDDFLEELQGTDQLRAAPTPVAHPLPAQALQGGPEDVDGSDLESLTLDLIRRAMEENVGNVSAVARQLGISRNTVYRKLKRNWVS